MTQPFFDWFVATCGIALDRHFPELGTLSESELARIVGTFAQLDEHHLAYAVTLLAHHSPRLLLSHLPLLASDARPSVWMAAERAISLLPGQGVEITREMLTELERAIAVRRDEQYKQQGDKRPSH
jgi:hypothetical protein